MNIAERYVGKALQTLEVKWFDKNQRIEIFGGHRFRVFINSEGDIDDLWSEMIRVHDDNGKSMVFRVITRKGVKHLATIQNPVFIVDNRPNIEAELEGNLYPIEQDGPYSGNKLNRTYESLTATGSARKKNKKVDYPLTDAILCPVREGSMGPTEEVGGYGPFTKPEQRYSLEVWDIGEERLMASAIKEALITKSMEPLKKLMDVITEHYLGFALPFINEFAGVCRVLHEELNEKWINWEKQVIPGLLRKTDLEAKSFTVDLGAGAFRVEQIIEYPYFKENGVLFVKLFRVWDAQNETFETVRVLQTKPLYDKENYKYLDALRLDSGCHDGMHSKDCHCDCDEQLEQVLKEGFESRNSTVVIQLQDHEGKNWGTVFKGATHYIMRKNNEDVKEGVINGTFMHPNIPASIGNPQASAQLYNALGRVHDNRDYRAAQAVIQVLGIEYVEALKMGNVDKVTAIDASGVKYKTVQPVEVNAHGGYDFVASMDEKQRGGIIVGLNGGVIYQHKASSW